MGTRFSARPDRPWGPPSLLYNGYRVFPGGKVRTGRAADHSPPSSAAVMEEYSYTSTHPLGHTGPVTGSLYLLHAVIKFFIFILCRNDAKSFERRRCRRMEKISCTVHMKCKEVLHSVKEERISYMQQNEGRTTGLVTSCVGTAFSSLVALQPGVDLGLLYNTPPSLSIPCSIRGLL